MSFQQKVWFILDPDEPLSLKDMPIIKLNARTGLSMLPSWVQAVIRAPIDCFDWFFGVKDALYMNLIANTEIVRRKALPVAERSYF